MHMKLISSLIISCLLLGMSLSWEDAEIIAQAGADANTEKPSRAAAPVKSVPIQVKKRTGILSVVDQADIHEEHKIIADEVLRLLPARCLSTLKNFYVRYESMGSRGYAGESTVILSGLVQDSEFRALLIHEAFGHLLDLGCLKGNTKSGKSEFKDGSVSIYRNDPSVEFYRISWSSEKIKKKTAKAADFVSGYAYKADVFEDLAESMTFYVLHRDVFAKRAKTNAALAEKLRWIETYVFPTPLNVAVSQAATNGEIPWDTTKLPYIWKPEAIAKK